MRYPIKLNDLYPCQGIDADGVSVTFEDLLSDGDRVGPWDVDQNEAMWIDAHVVRHEDGLWIEALGGDE